VALQPVGLWLQTRDSITRPRTRRGSRHQSWRHYQVMATTGGPGQTAAPEIGMAGVSFVPYQYIMDSRPLPDGQERGSLLPGIGDPAFKVFLLGGGRLFALEWIQSHECAPVPLVAHHRHPT
jgi:hypothetical protein